MKAAVQFSGTSFRGSHLMDQPIGALAVQMGGYGVTIMNDSAGSTKVLDCRVLKAVANVDCFKKF